MSLLLTIFLVTIFTVSCGGGGSSAASPSSSSSASGSAPTGALPGQIDPVEGT